MSDDQMPYPADADLDLGQRVKAVLRQPGYARHKALEVDIERGVVRVQGRVPTFYLRQIAVELIKRVAGVTQVVDRILVVDDSAALGTTDGSANEQPSLTGSREYRADHSFSTREVPDSSRSLGSTRRSLAVSRKSRS
jgi:osmotically-inducible protein OsmY